MRMRLVFACGAVLLLGALRTLTTSEGSNGPLPPPPAVDRSCKPFGPLDVELRPGERHADGSLEVAFSIRPVLDMRDVEWSLESTENVLVVDGPSTGGAAGTRGERTRGRARVVAPGDGERGHLRLVATGVFRGSDGLGRTSDERVEVVRSLTWGEHAPVGPVVTRFDAASGEEQRLVMLPARELGNDRSGR